MHPALRPRTLAGIPWRRDPHPGTERVFASLPEIMDRRAAQTYRGIIKARARDMLTGDLPMRACPKAAAIIARWHRRQMALRRAA